ncbi:MAG: hypothetical protein ABSD58_09400 [Verrucomicrobiia bacterium]
MENKLTQRPLRLLAGVEATVLADLDDRVKTFPSVRQAPQALYVFDPTFNKPALTDAKCGIADNGPYSQRGFTPSKPHLTLPDALIAAIRMDRTSPLPLLMTSSAKTDVRE